METFCIFMNFFWGDPPPYPSTREGSRMLCWLYKEKKEKRHPGHWDTSSL